MGFIKYEQLPSPGDRFVLGEEIGRGVCGRVVAATDTQSHGKTVAIKIQLYDKELRDKIDEEYRVLRDFSQYPNFPSLYGVYRRKSGGVHDEVWFVMEYCAGGSVVSLIQRLDERGRKLSELQIAFIIREVAKALLELHKSHIMCRDVKGSNVLLTSEGSIKLVDFGLAKSFESTLGKRGTCIGSPNWMAPEMFTNPTQINDKAYGSRADVWALGILAIELGDGHPPFFEMHPTRMIFQILRNPPPTLYRPSNWSTNYNDFISECLEKNPEHRPYLIEMLEHPFLAELPENDFHISQELKVINESVQEVAVKILPDEVAIFKGGLKRYSELPAKLFVEDLCALNTINESSIIETLKARQTQGNSFTFAGDVLISLNSNGKLEEIPRGIHQKYVSKTWSDNPPHIFAVADRAHQYMMHHEDPQFVVLSGETYSGKTTQFNNLVKHLCFIGEGNKNADVKVKESVAVIEALINAGTTINRNSTRAVFAASLIFGKTGKLSGAFHSVFLLEKGRVASEDMDQPNFHYFYYFYDAMKANNRLAEFDLEGHRNYRYLRIPSNASATGSNSTRDTPEKNVVKFHDVENALLDLDFDKDQFQSMYAIMAAILLLGEIKYQVGEDLNARSSIENPEVVEKVAKLLKVDEKKFSWALTNYCFIKNGRAERRKHTVDEAREARDCLAAVLYSRMVDWVINIMNQKFSVGCAIFGDHNSITLMDMFGFECFRRNKLEQLYVNCLNEQIQYFYNQRMFVWEMIEQEEEQIPTIADFHFYDNKLAVDQIMSKPYGLLNLMDDSTRSQQDHEQLTHVISTKKMQYVTRAGNHEVGIAHYTGKISYDARDWPEKNRDFVPPELFEALRLSNDPLVKAMSSNPLSKTGNLTLAFENPPQQHAKGKWTGALVAEKSKMKKLNTLSHGMYSQVHKMRTQSSVFRSTCLELMKTLSVSATSSGVHFVRCMRINLDNSPNMVQTELVRQQIRAMAIVDTALAGKKGYPYRIPFQEFLRRYKFLAFDFNETVELNRDNCRLLLIRLKMDGWIIGKTKVFLKFYNVEYLSRLYEVQVKKIVKVQAMMRTFLARRVMGVQIKKKLAKVRQNSQENAKEAEKAALFIQKAYRGYLVRKQYGPLICSKTGKIDSETASFIRPFVQRWKVRSIYQVLLQYRAARHMDLVQFMQQVHIFNQMWITSLTKTSHCVLMERIDPQQTNAELLGPAKMSVWKMPFRLDEIPYFDTSFLCDPDSIPKTGGYDSDDESWDAPLHRRKNVSSRITASTSGARHGLGAGGRETPNLYIKPFSRDPMQMDRRCSSPAPPAFLDQSTTLRPVSQRVGEFNSSEQYSVYKKRSPAPPPPPPAYQTNSQKKRQAPCPPKRDFDEDSFENRSPVKNKDKSPFNPAKELKMIANSSTTTRESLEENDNDPPFNFQGMLRKTQYNRASMKRDKSLRTSPTLQRDSPKTMTNTNAPNVVYHSKEKNRKERPKSCILMNKSLDENQNNLEVRTNTLSRKLSLQPDTFLGNEVTPADLLNNNNNGEDTEDEFTPETAENYIKEEIAPGVILEGLVEEV